jgi:hypothetical protein
MDTERIRNTFLFQEEFNLAYKLIYKGLGELQNINVENNFYFLPMLLLSQGIERFLKLYIFAFYDTKRINLTAEKRKLKTHDIKKLVNIIIEQNLFLYALNQNDMAYLKTNPHLQNILEIFSDFGHNGRYYNINSILKIEEEHKPIAEWEKLETKIIPMDIAMAKLMDIPAVQKDYYNELDKKIVIILEKFLSILSKQLRNNQLSYGTTLCNFQYFADLQEHQFGTKDYRIEKSLSYKKQHPHKRNFRSYIKSIFLYKNKTIRESSYNKKWPFKVKKITLEQRENKYYIIIINGYEYALNGYTSTHLKIQTINRSNEILGFDSLNDFLEIAKNL